MTDRGERTTEGDPVISARGTLVGALLVFAVVGLLLSGGSSGAVDADGDGLNATLEEWLGSSDNRSDTDSDGVPDDREYELGTNLTNADTDGDGLPDGREVGGPSSPTDPDTDGDGLLDGREVKTLGTDPNSTDTDQDGLPDPVEVEGPTSATMFDTDGDGVSDRTERNGPTNATRADTDGDGLPDGRELTGNTSAVDADTDGDGLSDGDEIDRGTDPTAVDSDGDGRPDPVELEDPALDPTSRELRTRSSPGWGWENDSLSRTTFQSLSFLAELPTDETRRTEAVTGTASTLCRAHDEVVPETAANGADQVNRTYRATYRIGHAVRTLDDLGGALPVESVESQLRTVREYGGMAAKYAPVVGAYQRLHESSCAVTRGEPGARQDFVIAAGAFAVDVTLAQQGIIYKAAFKTTGMATRAVGANRIARACGYKCLGLAQSEVYWGLNGAYSGAVDYLSSSIIEGNVTLAMPDGPTRSGFTDYMESVTDTRVLDGRLVPESKIEECISETFSLGSLWRWAGRLGTGTIDLIRTVLEDGRVPADADLSFLVEVDATASCVVNPD